MEQGTANISTHEVADLLDRLVGKSLIVFDAETGRYRQLETVRQYAREALLADMDRGGPNSHAKHAAHFHRIITSLPDRNSGPSLAQVEADYENYRSALDWWTTRIDGREALEMVEALYPYWYARGLFREGSEKAAAALDLRRHNKSKAYARALLSHADLTMHLGDIDLSKLEFKEVMNVAIANRDVRAEILALSGLAAIYQDYERDFELSYSYRMRALETSKQAGDKALESRQYYNLGDLISDSHPDLAKPERRREVYEEARGFFELAYGLNEPRTDPKLAIFIRAGLGGVAAKLNEFDLSLRLLIEGLGLSIESGYEIGHALILFFAAQTTYGMNRFEACLTFAIGAQWRTQQHGFTPGASAREMRQRMIDDSSSELGPEAAGAIAKRAATLPIEDFMLLLEKELGR